MLKLRRIIRSGGFVYLELAIALPLLVLLMYGLANVSIKIFYLGKTQLADYVLEEEAHDVLSRLIYDARAAQKVEFYDNPRRVKFTYHNFATKYRYSSGGMYSAVVYTEETRLYRVGGKGSVGVGDKGSKIYYQHENAETSPMTGENYFGETRVTKFNFSQPENNVLRVTLELQSEETTHKIKINTAVYMPACEPFDLGE